MQTLQQSETTLPLFIVPEGRWDAQRRLARLFRDICYNDARPEGCIAGNQFLAKQAGTVADHVRALLRQLKDYGLIEIEVRGPKRRIRPLVKLTEVMKRGWHALWLAILERDTFPSAVRRLAAILLKPHCPNRPDLEKLGIDLVEPASPPPAPKNSQESTTKAQEYGQAHTQEPSLGAAAVSLLTQKAGIPLPEAEMLAEGIAEGGGTLEQLQHAVTVASTSKLRSPAGFIRAAVRSAVRGATYLLSGGKPTHVRDLRDRPQRVVSAPKPKRKVPADWLPGVPYDDARGYCNEAMRLLRLAGTIKPLDAEIKNMAQQLWEKSSLK